MSPHRIHAELGSATSRNATRKWLVKIDDEIAAGPMTEREADHTVERLGALLTPPPDSPSGRLHRAYDHAFDDNVGLNLDALEAVAALRRNLDEQEAHAALKARRNGATWQEIADALGITRQRAHQRWGNISAFAGWDKTAD